MKVKMMPIFVLIAAMLFGQILVGAASGVGRAASTGSAHELRRSGSASDLLMEIWKAEEKKKKKPPLSQLEVEANAAFMRGDTFGGFRLQVASMWGARLQPASMVEQARWVQLQKKYCEAIEKVKFDYELNDEESELITAGHSVPLKFKSVGCPLSSR